MMYLSKGAPVLSDPFRVSQCGKVYELGPRLAGLWHQGRTRPVQVEPEQERAIIRMAEAGLVAVSREEGSLASFQMLNGCILCPSYRRQFRLPIYGCARRIWKWVRESGLKLTTSELIRLEELGTQPSPELLGDAGRQALTETIYNHTNILDGALEMEMERSPARDVTVTAILKLLRTHRLLLI